MFRHYNLFLRLWIRFFQLLHKWCSKSGPSLGGEGAKKEKCSAHSIMPPYFLSPLLPRMHNLKGNVFLYISFFIQPSPTSMVFLIFWKLQRNDVWSLIEVLKLNFCQDFEAAVYQDFEAEVSSRFWGFSWYFKSGSLVKILKVIFFNNFGHSKEITLVTALNLWAFGNVYLKWQGILVWVVFMRKGIA